MASPPRPRQQQRRPQPEQQLRPLLHWVNSLPGAGPRCLLAGSADDLVADGGRALCDLIGTLVPSSSSSDLDLAGALEALARHRPQAVRRFLLPSFAQADPRATQWDAAELARRLLRDSAHDGGLLLLLALLGGLQRVVVAVEKGDGGGVLDAAAPSPTRAAAAQPRRQQQQQQREQGPREPSLSLSPLRSRPLSASPSRRLQAPYHRHHHHEQQEEVWEGAAASAPPIHRAPPPSPPPQPQQQQRRRQRPPTLDHHQRHAAVRAWLAGLGLQELVQQEEGKTWEGDPVRDGRLLCRLFAALEPGIAECTKGLQRILDRTPHTRQEAAETVACALWLFRCRCSPPIPGAAFDDVDGIVEGRDERTWGLLWALMQLYAPPTTPTATATAIIPSSAAARTTPCWQARLLLSPTRALAPPPQQEEERLLESSLAQWLGEMGILPPSPSPSLRALESALRDGTLLCRLAERAGGRRIVGWHPRPASRDACLVNLTKSVEALRAWQAPLGRRFLYSGIEEDIFSGDWEAIVGLLEDVHRAFDGVLPPRPPIPSPQEKHYLGHAHSPPPPPLLDLYPDQDETEAQYPSTPVASPLNGRETGPLSSLSPLSHSAFAGGPEPERTTPGGGAGKGEEEEVRELVAWLAARGVVLEDPDALLPPFSTHATTPELADGVVLARLVAGLPDENDEEEEERQALLEEGVAGAGAATAAGIVPRLQRIRRALGALRRLRAAAKGRQVGRAVAAVLPLHLLHREIDVLEGRKEAVVPLLLGIKRVYEALGEEEGEVGGGGAW